MKKPLLIAGILLLIACVICLAVAALHLAVYRHAMDGSPALYERAHLRMILFAVIGIVLGLLGAGSLLLYFKK